MQGILNHRNIHIKVSLVQGVGAGLVGGRP